MKPVAWCLVFVALAACFWVAFHERYYRYKDCIDALTNSSCLTADGSNVTAGGAIWSLFALASTLAALGCLGVAIRRAWRARRTPPTSAPPVEGGLHDGAARRRIPDHRHDGSGGSA